MCDWLHLTQVPRAAVDDARVSAALTGKNGDLGSPGEGSELCARDHPQPVVGSPLRRCEGSACNSLPP